MKKVIITYWIKAAFLLLSWLILFNGLEVEKIDSKIFFISVLIYTGAIVFDLIFLCIETNAEGNDTTEGIYKGSLALTILNGIICVIEFIGAMQGLKIIENNSLVIKISTSGITEVFPDLLNCEFRLSWFMMLVLFFGLCSIIPGLLLARYRRIHREAN